MEHCSVCIFVATHRALKSSWCGAELGAFWGAGKPIIVYLADSSLLEDELPPLVQGDVWERRITRVVSRAKELVTEAMTASSGTGKLASVHVGNLTIDQLERVIVGAVSLATASAKSDGHAASPAEIGQAAKGAAGRVLEGIKSAERLGRAEDHSWRSTILWVDDRPGNNIYERQTLESMGITFTLALSTEDAPQSWPRSALRRSSPIWGGRRVREKGTSCWRGYGKQINKRPSSSTQVRMLQLTRAKPRSVGLKVLRIEQRSSSI